MHLLFPLLPLLTLLATPSSSSPAPAPAPAAAATAKTLCKCRHNHASTTWKDITYSPAHVVQWLSDKGGGCYQGWKKDQNQRTICVEFHELDDGHGHGNANATEGAKKCIKKYSKDQEGWQMGNWKMPSSINCITGKGDWAVVKMFKE
ncbi:hypothetical protein B0T14DRAFT_590507 [Immersiella caudata]|uniref:Uncharacterized protein n=1 Tax=Immersiella caudata TaxID=314043 RepID=A0AA40BXW2_9PEZI|nr:hypothetical protein B0T14DRAFT_590507 [Immersiella caudata]